MDKADIYEWIIQDEIKIMNLQSKIDKANKIIEKYKNTKTDDYVKVIEFYQEIRNTLKEDK